MKSCNLGDLRVIHARSRTVRAETGAERLLPHLQVDELRARSLQGDIPVFLMKIDGRCEELQLFLERCRLALIFIDPHFVLRRLRLEVRALLQR